GSIACTFDVTLTATVAGTVRHSNRSIRRRANRGPGRRAIADILRLPTGTRGEVNGRAVKPARRRTREDNNRQESNSKISRKNGMSKETRGRRSEVRQRIAHGGSRRSK